MIEVRKHAEDATDLYQVSKCCYMSIVIDSFRKQPGASQCYNCNYFPHSSANMLYKSRIHQMLRGTSHRGPIKERLENPVCINCNETGHVANWRSCKAFPKIKTKTGSAAENRNGNKKPANEVTKEKKVTPNLTFANTVNSDQPRA
ncbi:uncharacterized protein TNCT_238281 [Trichonephila clavata]|uniref:Uncharacterized protein n=1 Tax=Trichonephila clavata TaxID=2740835 RepID=A0A8X6IUR7_TRICU|nr:uncharacterized protein TNCT_238281 [Trichonephila clavata]